MQRDNTRASVRSIVRTFLCDMSCGGGRCNIFDPKNCGFLKLVHRFPDIDFESRSFAKAL
jgi:hypothetical protein